jgi:diguanylate cyclase (GGDEF)-like protein
VHLDIVSSLISVGALSTLMGLWMLSASYARGETNTHQLRIWSISCLIFGIAYVLFASRENIPVFWSLVVGNLLFALGYGGFGLAIARLFKKRFPFLIVLTGILLCMIALFFTEVVYGNSSWRILILAAVTAVPWTVSFIHCTREWKKKPAPHILAMSLAFLAMILVSFSRVGYAAYYGEFGYEGLPTGAGYLFGTYVLVISPVLLTVGFFLLCAEQTQEVIKKLADTDPLTGILNRRSALLLAVNRMASAKRRRQEFACVTIDLDDLKIFNDEHGHAAGDLVLKHLTTVVGGLVRAEDVFGRLGGDEFVVFMPYADFDGATSLAERFREAIVRQPLVFFEHELTITASFGVACLHETDQSPLDLLNRADRALYDAKRQGGNTVKTADPAAEVGTRSTRQ